MEINPVRQPVYPVGANAATPSSTWTVTDEVVPSLSQTENAAERTYRLAAVPLPRHTGFLDFLKPRPSVLHKDYGNGGGVTFYRVPGEIAPRYQFTGSASDLNGYRMLPGQRTWSWSKPGWV